MFPKLTIDYLKANQLILFETLSGSHAYGLNVPTSDVDLRGVFILPQDWVLANHYVEQVADAKNDILYYEVGRFLQLAAKNNPGMLELLFAPPDCVRVCHPAMEIVFAQRERFLTRRCEHSFGGYAVEQIKKARGLNKKIVNPMEPERKTPLDFCYILEPPAQSTVPAPRWLAQKGWRQEACGLLNLPHATESYALFHDPNAPAYPNALPEQSLHYRGLAFEESNDLRLSSIPKDQTPAAYLFYNKDGYSAYCKRYQEYWQWTRDRNEARYQQNADHGKGYDTKNMMHCLRLLEMACEIGREGVVRVRRPNREELLSIRRGEMEYDALLERATALMQSLPQVFAQSALPPDVPQELIFDLTLKIRKAVGV